MNRSLLSAFRRAARRAQATVAGDQPLGRLLSAARALLGRNPAALRRVAGDATAVLRLVRETLAGHYRQIPKRSLVAALAALVYLVDPLDLIPDVLPVLGLLDDAVVFTWVVRQIRRDIDAFLAWEREWGGAIDVDGAEVVTPPTAALPQGPR